MTCTPNTLRAHSCEHPLVTAQQNHKSTLTVMTLNLWGANRWRSSGGRRSSIGSTKSSPTCWRCRKSSESSGRCQASWIAATHGDDRATFGAASSGGTGPVRQRGAQPPADAAIASAPSHRCSRRATSRARIVTVDVDACGRSVCVLVDAFVVATRRGMGTRAAGPRHRRHHRATTPRLPPIVCGDFNATPRIPRNALHRRSCISSTPSRPRTRAGPATPGATPTRSRPPNGEPDRRIDYIFVGAATCCPPTSCATSRAEACGQPTTSASQPTCCYRIASSRCPSVCTARATSGGSRTSKSAATIAR